MGCCDRERCCRCGRQWEDQPVSSMRMLSRLRGEGKVRGVILDVLNILKEIKKRVRMGGGSGTQYCKSA